MPAGSRARRSADRPARHARHTSTRSGGHQVHPQHSHDVGRIAMLSDRTGSLERLAVAAVRRCRDRVFDDEGWRAPGWRRRILNRQDSHDYARSFPLGLAQHLTTGTGDLRLPARADEARKPARAPTRNRICPARASRTAKPDLAGPKTGRNGRHPLPDPQVFMGWLGRNGVDAGKQVVAYDYAAGSSAARLWWMLRWVGHERVAVLDGGWEGWVKAGLPVTAEQPHITSTHVRRRAATAMGRCRVRQSPPGRPVCGRAGCPHARAFQGADRADRSGRGPHSRRAQPPVQGQPRCPMVASSRRMSCARPSWTLLAGPARADRAPVRLGRERLPATCSRWRSRV